MVLAISATAIGLGRWQLRRLRTRRASNVALIAARMRPPLVLPGGAERGGAIDSGRRIVARGSFDASGEVILRGRAFHDTPGLQIATPFVIDSTRAVLWVVRGFVGSPDAVTPPDRIAATASGDVTIHGVAFAIPTTADGGRPLLHNGVTTWQRLDRTALAARRPGSLPVYLLLEGDSTGPGRLETTPPPELNDGPHLSYAIQWFGIAAAVLTFGALLLWRDGRGLPRPPGAP